MLGAITLGILGRDPGSRANRLSVFMYTERFNYLDKQLSFSEFAGTQALQVIENINYLLGCHAGGRGFESGPLRHFFF
jgi:hypothetical protein